jgi:hypothetical protein
MFLFSLFFSFFFSFCFVLMRNFLVEQDIERDLASTRTTSDVAQFTKGCLAIL